jgi:hypothetical protein
MSPDADTLEEGTKIAEESPLDSNEREALPVRSERNKWYALGIFVVCCALLAIILPTTLVLRDKSDTTSVAVEVEVDPEVPEEPEIEVPEDYPSIRPPTPSPTSRPTNQPTGGPNLPLTRRPTKQPTREPTLAPTRQPTREPNPVPTIRPTDPGIDSSNNDTRRSFLLVDGPFPANLTLFNEGIVGQPYANPALLQEDLENAGNFFINNVVKRNTNVKGFENVGFGGRSPNTGGIPEIGITSTFDDIAYATISASSPAAEASAQGPAVGNNVNDFGTNNQETDVEEGDVIVSDGERGK